MKVVFNKIIYENIFKEDFTKLVKYNELSFENNKEIIVVYGPNGTGKTSLVNVLAGVNGSEIDFTVDGVSHDKGNDKFYVISDQNNRNVIVGETKDFLLGDNIRLEYELKEKLKSEREKVINAIIEALKVEGISSSRSPIIEVLLASDISLFVKDCANNRSRGDKYSDAKLIDFVNSLENIEVSDYDEEQMEYFKDDYNRNGSIIKQLEAIVHTTIVANVNIKEIEENTEAIRILERFDKNTCIVCDTANIDRDELLRSKKENKKTVLQALDDEIKIVIEKIIEYIPTQDSFHIKQTLLDAIEVGDSEKINQLVQKFSEYKYIYGCIINSAIKNIFDESSLVEIYEQYQAITSRQVEITDDDCLYISEVIANSMNKELSVERDDKNVLRIKLSSNEFLGKERSELPLSNGEQNFLSLSFELLKAKKTNCPIVVIDDPVSSFDSIYKNKVAYAIIKILNCKKRIVLTHNTDLIRLLQSQYKDCFKLYFLNNVDGEVNGFIPINNEEKGMLINLEALLNEFRSAIPKHVNSANKELFLISMIPFMRGYAKIVNNVNVANTLTNVMHGYKTDIVDIGSAYTELFGNQGEYLPTSYKISVSDVLSKSIGDANLIDQDKYPLLNKTLRHSFTYLFLRLLVEKKLVEKYDIDTTVKKQLGEIISAAYPNDFDLTQVKSRIKLTAKKTLINEFNHFEGNLSIFQPAIDITDHTLNVEYTDIMSFIESLK